MFGMGGTEIIVILIVALLFLGPDKLPEAAKQISKGIRDLKKQSRALQRTIEDDEHIGGAIRDLKSALRGDEEPLRPKPIKPAPALIEAGATPVVAAATAALAEPAGEAPSPAEPSSQPAPATGEPAAADPGAGEPTATAEPAAAPAFTLPAKLTLPATAGEPDDDVPAPSAVHDAELAALVKPAANTIARTAATPPDEPTHG